MRLGIDREGLEWETSSTGTLSFSSVSALDRNVIFQDMDNPPSRSRLRPKTPVEEQEPPTQEPDHQTMGLISNIFMGSTNRFVKGVEKSAVTANRPKDTI